MAADPTPAAPVAADWVAIGPSVMRGGQAFTRPPVSGRVPSLAISRFADVIYAASANGGVWRTDDAGQSWRPLMDGLDFNPSTVVPAGQPAQRADSLAVGAVAIHPDHPERVYAGSGEPQISLNFFGVGPQVSRDGGRTWVTEPVSGPPLAGQGFYALVVDPADPELVVGATTVGLYLRVVVAGVPSWRPCALPIGMAPCPATSVVNVRGVFFAALSAVAADATAAPPVLPQASVVLRSADRGQTWQVVGAGFPAGAARVTLAVHPDRIDVVYAVTDSGDLWRARIDATGNGPWLQVAWVPAPAGIGSFVGANGTYDLALAVDPSNVDTVFCGGSTLMVDGAGRPVLNNDPNRLVFASQIWRVGVSMVGGVLTAAPTYIGATVHADVHALVFPRGLPGQLWVGCDGGVFVCDSAQATAPTFRSLNSGLATTQHNTLAQHPTEPAVMFSGTQDNGGLRMIGDEVWSLATDGDGGYCVVDWNNPYRVLMGLTRRNIQRFVDGGSGPASVTFVILPALAGDTQEFYPPIAGAPVPAPPTVPPYAPAVAAQAGRVAAGTRALWLSNTFADPGPVAFTGDWATLPAGIAIPGGSAADMLGANITAISFASFTTIHVGTARGEVHRYVEAPPGTWTRTRIDNAAGGALPLGGAAITDIETDPADASGNSLYICFGGLGNRRRVWHFNNVLWSDRSGPAGVGGLLDAQVNALVADPDNVSHLYAATDAGVWGSIDSGLTWQPFTQGGLPEAAAVDLLIHRPSRLIRVATYGRGVFMRRLGAPGAAPPTMTAPVELYVREHRLDFGLGQALYGQPDPAAVGATIAAGSSPDVRCDAPDAQGAYRFPGDRPLSLIEFFDLSHDDSAAVATAAQPVATRVQVLVHNRGPRWAHDVQVAVLIAEGRHGTLPSLPTGWAAQLRRGQAVVGNGWRTVGFSSVSDLRPGHPQVATIELPSSLLPLPAALAGHDQHTLLIALHHADDPLLSDVDDAEDVADNLRQVALRHITVVALAPSAAAGPTVPSRFLPIGPSPMLEGQAQGNPPVAGRTPGLAVSRHGDILYAGTANGGVWRSDDGGARWRSCMEAFDLNRAVNRVTSLACPAVAIHPDRPELVFVGTGEPFGNVDAYFGVGMLVSLDGGRNWLEEPTVFTLAVVVPVPPPARRTVPPATPTLTLPLLQQKGCYAIAVDPLAPERAVAATSAGAFLRQPDDAGGFHWRRTWFALTMSADGLQSPGLIDDEPRVTGVTCAAEGGVTTFVAALGDGRVFAFKTDSAEFQAGQPVWRPLSPATWPANTPEVRLPSQLPAPPPQVPLRCTVAMKEDDAKVVYLVRRDGSGFRYDAPAPAAAGVPPLPLPQGQWQPITPMPTDPTPPSTTPGTGTRSWVDTQGWYNLALAVDPRNVDSFVIGGSTVYALDDQVVANGTPGGNWCSSIWACSVTADPSGSWTMTSRYIGARAHADVHRLVFTPGDGSQLWTGNDGGVFRCDNWDQQGAFFVHRNRGLATLSGNSVDTHPVEDAIVLLSTQDNGAALGLGTSGWRSVMQGDSGASVWQWGDVVNGRAPRALVSYINYTVKRLTMGAPDGTEAVNVPAPTSGGAAEAVAFYPPMVGTPHDPANPGNAGRVAFGARRLWLTENFGSLASPPTTAPNGDWASVPTGTATSDCLPGTEVIVSLLFLTHDRIVAGTSAGNCYLYENRAGTWSRPQALGKVGTWPAAARPVPSVTGMCLDPAGGGLAFYACLGGDAGPQRVWHAAITLDAAAIAPITVWTPKSGTAAPNALLDVNHNTIIADGGDLYVGADIGIWHSSNGGDAWQPFSEGVPDAPVLDLELAPNRILRASTHGRGVYERQLPPAPVPRVRLVVRETVLDRGLRAATYTGFDHLARAVTQAASPDIVVDAPQDEAFQTSPNLGLDHIGFARLTDRSASVATSAEGVLNRVHVQVQNGGPEACHGATVSLLLAEAQGGSVPALPADYAAAVRSGLPVTGNGWVTVGISRLGELDAREPAIASFDLHSSLLPLPGDLDGRTNWYLLALTHHQADPFPDTSTAVRVLADTHRQAALKGITVTRLDGDVPLAAAPPRRLPTALPLAVAIAADRRLAALAHDSRIRVVSGDALHDTDHALDALVQAALGQLRGAGSVPGSGAASGLDRFAVLGTIGLDLPDWSHWLEDGPGWLRDALRRGSADADVSATVTDAITVLAKTADYALAGTGSATEQAQIRAFCAGMACAVASDWVMGPVLRGIAAQRGPADPGRGGDIDLAIAETWVSRALLESAPETDTFADWLPDELPPTLLPALLRAVQEVATDALAAQRVETTPAPLPLPDADELEEGFGLARTVQAQGAWGMGIWFLVLLPVVLAPSLAVMFARFGDHSGRLLRIADESKGADDPANDSDERSWFQAADFALGANAIMPFAYQFPIWAAVPRRDADFVQFTVAGGLRIILTAVAAAAMPADPGLRWGLIFLPWIGMDLYFFVRAMVHYAQGRPGSGFMYLMQTLPMMGLGLVWLFCLLIRGANLRKDGEFWGMWALFTGLLLGGGLFMAWRLAAGGGLMAMLRDRRDPALPFDAFAGRDLLALPPARALVHADHQLWQQGPGVAGERYPAGMRPLLKLWHDADDWEIRPFGDHIEFRQNGGAPVNVALPKVQNAAQLLASLTGAVAGLHGAVVAPDGFELPWPVRVADHGDDQPSWAAHDTAAALWRALPDDADKPYLLRHAPRSRTASALGAPTRSGVPAEGPLHLVPGRDADDPLGEDLVGTALGRAGDLAALFQMALAPVLNPGLQVTLAGVATPLQAGREVLRRWNLDERRENEWRLLVGLDAVPDQAAERLHPGAAAPAAGDTLARIGLLPTLDAWGRVLRDDRIDLNADIGSPAMPLLRPRGEAPRPVTHRELRDALRTLLNVP